MSYRDVPYCTIPYHTIPRYTVPTSVCREEEEEQSRQPPSPMRMWQEGQKVAGWEDSRCASRLYTWGGGEGGGGGAGGGGAGGGGLQERLQVGHLAEQCFLFLFSSTFTFIVSCKV